MPFFVVLFFDVVARAVGSFERAYYILIPDGSPHWVFGGLLGLAGLWWLGG
jgi:hypothetical protein